MTHPNLALVLSGFPRRSETFALNEALALEARGMLAAIFATKAGDGQTPQPGSERLLHRVHYLQEGDACAQAAEMTAHLQGKPLTGIHAYFAHTPAEVAELASRKLNLPFGFSTHAKDARKVAPNELARRANAAACVVACNPDVASELRQVGADVTLLPHGVDIQRFVPTPLPLDLPIRLLAVGRLVEKKGFDVLLKSLVELQFPFHLQIIGDGPQRQLLADFIEQQHLTNQVTLTPSMTHEQLAHAYATAHIVVAPSVVDRNGDRDGLPNVVLEAMASARPVVASDVAAISSAIRHEETGLLTAPGKSSALAAALTRLAFDPSLRQSLGQRARACAEKQFSLGSCSTRFCDYLEQVYRYK